MLRVNEFQLYELATIIHPLTEITHEAKYSQVWSNLYRAKEALQNLFKQRSLEVCFGTANDLYIALGKVVPVSFEEAVAKIPAEPSTEQELGWEVHAIKIAAEKFETVISAELSNSDTYWISPKGTHKTSMLLQYAHMELPTSILTEVPEVKSDFDEAGRCLLFDTATATGFHLLRATEAVIRKYYKAAIGTDPPVKFRNWGAYVKVLRKSAMVDQKVVSMIDHIREHYRNPILHPADDLTTEDAQVLFGLCVSAITLMGQDMKSIAQKSQTLPFPCGLLLGTTGQV